MIAFSLFGYRVNIRKERKLNPRDCRGWYRKCENEKIRTTAALRNAYGYPHTKTTTDRIQRRYNG